MPTNPSRRKMTNFLLMPVIQIKLGVYLIAAAGLLLVGLFSTVYFKMKDLAQIIIDLTDVEEEVIELITSHLHGMIMWMLLIAVVYVIVSLAVSVVYTHRLVGPIYAFIRHVRSLKEGNYSERTHLRKGDAFADLALELNELSEELAKKYPSSSLTE